MIASLLLIPILLLLLGVSLKYLGGPLLGYELVRASRRQHVFLLRAGYATVLFILLLLIYSTWFPSTWALGVRGLFTPPTMRTAEIARFAESIFSWFRIIQILIVVILTPILVGGAIWEDSKNGTFELLLTTHVSVREILISKLISRLIFMLLLLFTGIPVLALLQLLGGVDPWMLLGTYSILFVMLVWIASVALLQSVTWPNAGKAMGTTVLWMVYGFLGGFLAVGIMEMFGGSTISGQPISTRSLSFILIWEELSLQAAKGTLPQNLGEILLIFGGFYGGMSVLLLWLACRRLHSFEERKHTEQGAPTGQKLLASSTRTHSQNLLDHSPVRWKEPGDRLWMAPVSEDLSVPAILLVCILIGPLLGLVMGCIVISYPIILIGLSIRAAGSLAQERERSTLESLLLTSLTPREILRDKFRAVFDFIPWVFLLPGGVFFMLFVLALIPFSSAVSIMMFCGVAATIYLVFGVALGTYCSVRAQSTLRARTWCALLLIFCLGGHRLFTFVIPPLLEGILGTTASEWLNRFLVYGLTLPYTVGTLFSVADLRKDGSEWTAISRLLCAGFGLVLYLVAANQLWKFALRRFECDPLGHNESDPGPRP